MPIKRQIKYKKVHFTTEYLGYINAPVGVAALTIITSLKLTTLGVNQRVVMS